MGLIPTLRPHLGRHSLRPWTVSNRSLHSTIPATYQHILYLGNVLGYTSPDRLAKFPRAWLDSVGVSGDVDHGLRWICASGGSDHLLLGYEMLDSSLGPVPRARQTGEELTVAGMHDKAEKEQRQEEEREQEGELLEDLGGTTSTSRRPSKVFALGRNTHAQLGLGFSSQEATRGMVTGQLSGSGGVQHVVAGNGFSYVITCSHDHAAEERSNIFAFGNDTLGQIGASPAGSSATHNQVDPYDVSTRLSGSDAPQLRLLPLPKQIDLGEEGWSVKSIASGLDHTLLLVEREVNGYIVQQLFSTGLNTDGQLGRTPVEKADEVPIQPLLSRHFTRVPISTLPIPIPTPARAREDDERVIEVICGADTSYALTKGGGLWVWGNSEYGQSFAGVHDRIVTPVFVENPLLAAYEQNGLGVTEELPRIAKVVAGGSFAAILDTQGRVWVAGYGPRGQPNSDDPQQWASLALIEFESGARIQGLFCGLEYLVATSAAEEVFIWGIAPRSVSTEPIVQPTRIPYTLPRTPRQKWLDENPRLKAKLQQEAKGPENKTNAKVRVQHAACTRDHLLLILDDGAGTHVWAECDQPPRDKGTDVTL